MEELVREGSLGSILFKSRIITEDDIRLALEEQKSSGCRIGEALIKLKIVTQEDIDWALSSQLDIPYVRLKSEMIDRDAVGLVSGELARKFNLIPLIRVGDELNIALSDPLNKGAVEAVQQATGCRVSISVALIREIREMQDIFYGPEGARNTLEFFSTAFPPQAMEAINADITGARLLDYLLLHIFKAKLSSLSLEPTGETVHVTGKRGGRVGEVGRLSISRYPDFMLRLRKLSRINGSTDFSANGAIIFMFKGKKIRFQVSLMRALDGDFVTIRPLFSPAIPSSLMTSGMDCDKLLRLRKLAAVGHGMVLFSSFDMEERCRFMDMFLGEVRTAGKRVVLIGEGLGREKKEFPRIPLSHVPATEGSGVIAAALEHDPDILAIEDITDTQTFIAAGKAAMRGKLVIGGLSLGGTEKVLRHLLMYRHKHYLIPAQIMGVVTFKRLPTLCPLCREAYAPPAAYAAAPGFPAEGAFSRAVGCPSCGETGYSGTKYILDVVPFDDGFRKVFDRAGECGELFDFLKGRGYRSMAEEGADLLRAGEISPEEFSASIII